MLSTRRSHLSTYALLLLTMMVLSGCSILFGGRDADAEPTEVPRALVPTFTPTPEGQAPAEPVVEQVAVQESGEQEPAAQEEAAPPVEPTPTPEPAPEPTAIPTPEPNPEFVVSQEIVNVRQGPGTNYGIAGSVNSGTALEIIGKNEQGDWWQVCCVNGEPGWIFAQLGTASNTEAVAVAQNIPAPPAPAPQPPAPEPQPEPPQEEAPPPQPQGDPDAGPCGGDDGCKFRIVGGPSTGGNGGGELKMQLAFVHGGRGDEAQGSYFVVLKKDGVKLPVGDQVRSIAKNKSPGQLGEYNYEYKLGVNQLPGNTVAGNYTIWVLDGNGERDSDIFTFNIADGQNGLLWIKFDQG